MSDVKSKTLATWLAFLGGAMGVHRLYLHGLQDMWAWLHIPLTGLGLWGVQRVQTLGQDDRLSWLLLPLLGAMIAQACLFAILYGLTSDAKWAERFAQPERATAWGPVLGVIAALIIGASALMATVAFSGQRFFEWQLESQRTQRNVLPTK
jgi:TM2 domain